jgi:hypothetical protein
MKDKILNTILTILSLIAVILLFVFKDNILHVLYVICTLLFIFGLIFAIKKNKYGLVAIAIGITLSVSLFLYQSNYLDKTHSITFFTALLIGTITLVSDIFLIVEDMQVAKKYKVLVEATCIDLEKDPNSKSDVYLPIYGYEYKKKVYEVEFVGYLEKDFPEIGSTRNIRINPEKPTEAYFMPHMQTVLKNIFLSIFLVVVSILVIISAF